jgi:hypothetical protein
VQDSARSRQVPRCPQSILVPCFLGGELRLLSAFCLSLSLSL